MVLDLMKPLSIFNSMTDISIKTSQAALSIPLDERAALAHALIQSLSRYGNKRSKSVLSIVKMVKVPAVMLLV